MEKQGKERIYQSRNRGGMLRASIFLLVSSLLGCRNKSGAQQLQLGDSRVCQENRAGAKKTNDVSIAPLQFCQAAWEFQPQFSWAVVLELAHPTINVLCLCKTSLLLGRGVRV